MIRNCIALAAMAWIVTGQMALAQSGPTTGFGAPAAEAASTPSPINPSPAPQSAPNGAQELTQRAISGDWAIMCVGDTDQCVMAQLAINPEGTPAAEVEMVRLGGNTPAAAGITVLTPLGVLLEEGFVTRIDDNDPRRREYQVCSQRGCVVRYGATGEEVNEMRAGNTLRFFVSAVNVPQNPVTLTLSLRGFTAAYNQLTPQTLR